MDRAIYNHFNFKEIKDKTYLVTNDYGGLLLLDEDAFSALLLGHVESNTELYKRLYEEFFIVDNRNIRALPKQLQQMKPHISHARDSSLLVLKLTNYCNYNCRYCQASSRVENKECMMSLSTAINAINMVVEHGVKHLVIEFQGGEPLYCFDLIKQIVEYAETYIASAVTVCFRIMSNLSFLNDEICGYLEAHGIMIGTSLDGPKDLNNSSRVLKNGKGTFDLTYSNLKKYDKYFNGIGYISTVPKSSLGHAKEFIDFRFQEPSSFYIRPLFNLGRANEIWDEIGYTAEEFNEFYKQCMDYMLEKCLKYPENGVMECRTSEIASRLVLKEFSDIEISSPCGSVGAMVSIDWNGDVLACEGSKMIRGKTTRDKFILGNVNEHNSFEIFYNRKTMNIVKNNNSAADLHCSRCVYSPFCGNCNVERCVSQDQHLFDCKINEYEADYVVLQLMENEAFTNLLVKWLIRHSINTRGISHNEQELYQKIRRMFKVITLDSAKDNN